MSIQTRIFLFRKCKNIWVWVLTKPFLRCIISANLKQTFEKEEYNRRVVFREPRMVGARQRMSVGMDF